MFIDVHVHPDFYEPINSDHEFTEFRRKSLGIFQNSVAPLEHVINQMRCAGLDKLFLLPRWDADENGRPAVSNEEISLLASKSERFTGFAGVNPLLPGAADELEKAFSNLHLKGLKLLPSKHGFFPADERCDPIYSICEKYDRPVIFHSGLSWEPGTLSRYAHPLEFEELAIKHPKLRFCLGHFGWPWVKDTAMLMLKYRNVYADTACLYFDSAAEFYRQTFTVDIPSTWIDRSLRHQVMFGSNNPRFEQMRMAKALETLGFKDGTLDLIRGGNALEFLGGKA